MNQNNYPASSHSQKSSVVNTLLDPMIVSELQKNLSQKDQVISHLLERAQAMELQIQNKTSIENTKSSNMSSETRSTGASEKMEKQVSSIKNSKTSNTSKNSYLRKRRTIKDHTLKIKNDRSKTKHPLQMTNEDYPSGYENTKLGIKRIHAFF
ncbi:hypothetical protein O181_122233 [Austropuccinia psidii MF-1]|uniref:Uncharacterized protein n=1 Tax=Austropuccinia psidii MF-1 TaxID=1389203 RepID=A0A9Q3KJE2_9BASI|nr:hypothetical protein [Austropuccinia psidii MF-1]